MAALAPVGLAPPKRGLTAYLIFLQETRPAVVAANPDLPFGAVGQRIGEMWKALSDEERKPYEERALADRERYKAEMQNFPAYLARKVPSKKAQKAQKAARLHGSAPAVTTFNAGSKRPRTSYAFFMMAARPVVISENPALTFGEVGRLVGERWKALSDADKQPYIDLANADKAAKGYL